VSCHISVSYAIILDVELNPDPRCSYGLSVRSVTEFIKYFNMKKKKKIASVFLIVSTNPHVYSVLPSHAFPKIYPAHYM